MKPPGYRYGGDDHEDIPLCMKEARGLTASEVAVAVRPLQPGIDYMGCGKGVIFHAILTGEYYKPIGASAIVTAIRGAHAKKKIRQQAKERSRY